MASRAAAPRAADDITVLLLAGGSSRRMGVDKRRIVVDGLPLVRRTADLAREALPEAGLVVLAADAADAAGLAELLPTSVRFALDPYPDCGPLAALVRAAGQVTSPWLMLLAADMPGLAPATLRGLAGLRDAAWDAIVPFADERLQGTCGLYSQAAVARLAEVHAAGELGLQRALNALADSGALRLRSVPPADWAAWSVDDAAPFAPFNTPAEQEAWRRSRGEAPPA